MFERVPIKNPGCQYCRYFLPQFQHNGKPTSDACTKNARKIFEQNPLPGRKRKWKWSDCEFPHEKNKDRFCKDFQIESLLHKTFHFLSLIVRKAGQQYPPTFSGEIWWEP